MLFRLSDVYFMLVYNYIVELTHLVLPSAHYYKLLTLDFNFLIGWLIGWLIDRLINWLTEW